jgi:hypothetical protein
MSSVAGDFEPASVDAIGTSIVEVFREFVVLLQEVRNQAASTTDSRKLDSWVASIANATQEVADTMTPNETHQP